MRILKKTLVSQINDKSVGDGQHLHKITVEFIFSWGKNKSLIITNGEKIVVFGQQSHLGGMYHKPSTIALLISTS